MTRPVAYDDAVDLLEADHKAVEKLFMDYGTLCDDKAPAEHKDALAHRICQALSVHAQLEEEIFYPQIREAIADDALMDEALEEHAQAKATMARVAAMRATDAAYDATVKELGKRFDRHVLRQRPTPAFDHVRPHTAAASASIADDFNTADLAPAPRAAGGRTLARRHRVGVAPLRPPCHLAAR